jgi:hypothetical protein
VTSSLFTALVAIALAVEIGAHLAIVGGLVARRPRWRGLVALVFPPLVPLWGWQVGMRARVYVWTAAFAVYAAAVGVAATFR